MAKAFKTDKGFKIIELNADEAINVSFGPICDNCNAFIANNEKRYYIPVMNRIFCEDCYNDWHENATYCPEDTKYENRYYKFYCEALNIDSND